MHNTHIRPFILLLILVLSLTSCGILGEEESETPSPAQPTSEQDDDTAQAADPTDEPDEEPADPTEPTEPTEPAEPTDEPDNNTVRMAQADWNTGWFQAAIYKQLLEDLGYEVSDPETLPPGDFYPALAAGEYDLWVNGWFPLHNSNVNEAEAAVGSESIVPIGSQSRGGALQGYLIDKTTADAAGITSLADLQDPAVAELFDADGNGKADLLGCNEGWGCESVINHHLEEYGLGGTVEHVQGTYSDLMLEGIDRFEEGEPILFYTWTPNWPLNKLEAGTDVIWLEVPYASLPGDMASQEDITTVPDIPGCASNPCNLGFPLNDIRAVANRAFLDANPAALRLLELVQIPREDIVEQNDTMFFGEDSPEDIRRHAESWIARNDAQVRAWLEAAAAWEEQPTLDRVQERGVLRCGVQEDLIGFSTSNPDGSYSGFNADFCRAVAAAALGDADAVEFVPLNTTNRFAAVSDRQVDVLFHNVAWLALRDVGMNPPNSGIRLAFGPTLFHDGQRFMLPEELNITELSDLAGRNICVLAGSTAEDNLVEQLAVNGIEITDFELNRQDTADELYDTYERGGCDVVTADTSELVARRAGFVNPEAHVILNAQISREPHSPVFIEGDAEWGDVVSWAVNATIYAEELELFSTNVEEMRASENPDIARILGQRGQIGDKLGLDNSFAYTIIRDVGNYKEIYDRNIGPGTELDLERGPNKTWNSPEGPGGLLSAPPFR